MSWLGGLSQGSCRRRCGLFAAEQLGKTRFRRGTVEGLRRMPAQRLGACEPRLRGGRQWRRSLGDLLHLGEDAVAMQRQIATRGTDAAPLSSFVCANEG